MLLLDIGNSSVKIQSGGEIVRHALEGFDYPRVPFCYINVNPTQTALLEALPQARDLGGLFRFESRYAGMGVDRIAACYTIDNGVVVDAGSAVTVDLMRGGSHAGGFIMPGFSATKACFANISSRLVYDLDKRVALDSLPQNTAEALRYATIKPLLLTIADIADSLPIYLTGGDARRIACYLEDAIVIEDLLFRGMEKVIKESGITC